MKKALVQNVEVLVMMTIASLLITFVLLANMDLESFTLFVFDIIAIIIQASLVRLWFVVAREELKQEEAKRNVEFRMIVRSVRHD